MSPVGPAARVLELAVALLLPRLPVSMGALVAIRMLLERAVLLAPGSPAQALAAIRMPVEQAVLLAPGSPAQALAANRLFLASVVPLALGYQVEALVATRQPLVRVDTRWARVEQLALGYQPAPPPCIR